VSETYAPSAPAGHDDAGASSPRYSRRTLAFLVGVPLAWAVLLLFHPGGDGKEMYADLHDQATAMLVVHVGMMLFIPLMAVAVLLLLRGVEGTAAQISRVALVPFVVFCTAWETLQGIANGILVHELNGRPAADRPAGAELIQDFVENPLARDMGIFAVPGSLGLITALVLAGVALRRHAGASAVVAGMLGLSGFLITAHPPPYGPVGLGLFAAAVLLFAHSRPAVATTRFSATAPST
jgi:hypothetical protein